jgi:hypothetical protein
LGRKTTLWRERERMTWAMCERVRIKCFWSSLICSVHTNIYTTHTLTHFNLRMLAQQWTRTLSLSLWNGIEISTT